MFIMLNSLNLHIQTVSSYRRGVDPGESFPAVSFAASLWQNF